MVDLTRHDPAASDVVTSSAVIGHICADCIERVHVDGGGVSVMTAQGYTGTVWASDALATKMEDIQFTLGEGPCLDAATTGRAVLVSDLSERPHLDDRWPGFRAEAMASGVQAVFGIPLGVGEVRLGSINLYRRTPGALSPRQVEHATAAANATSSALLGLSSSDSSPDANADGAAYHWRVHQAAGMLTLQLGITVEEALLHLRATAFAESIPVDELAADVVARSRRMSKEDT